VNAANFEMPFGKHKGCTLGDILERDAGYLNWLQEECDLLCQPRHESLAEAVAEICEEHEEKIEFALRSRRAERF
jgi:uncharacterized protein (DUF3820 family)